MEELLTNTTVEEVAGEVVTKVAADFKKGVAVGVLGTLAVEAVTHFVVVPTIKKVKAKVAAKKASKAAENVEE